MTKNQIQFQKGLSISDFMDSYGTEEKCFNKHTNLHRVEFFYLFQQLV